MPLLPPTSHGRQIPPRDPQSKPHSPQSSPLPPPPPSPGIQEPASEWRLSRTLPIWASQHLSSAREGGLRNNISICEAALEKQHFSGFCQRKCGRVDDRNNITTFHVWGCAEVQLNCNRGFWEIKRQIWFHMKVCFSPFTSMLSLIRTKTDLQGKSHYLICLFDRYFPWILCIESQSQI